ERHVAVRLRPTGDGDVRAARRLAVTYAVYTPRWWPGVPIAEDVLDVELLVVQVADVHGRVRTVGRAIAAAGGHVQDGSGAHGGHRNRRHRQRRTGECS